MSSRPRTKVLLHVYDLVDNAWTYWCGVGIFHSGVEIYGVEYAYGGHEYDAPGVFATNPREAPGTVTWREAIEVGTTDLTPAEVHEVVLQMGATYRGNRYHLLQMNCNTFSSDLCQRLTGAPAPPWVNRLANMAVMLHCLLPQSLVPPLRPPSVAPGAPGSLLIPEQAAAEEKRRLLSPLDEGSGGGRPGGPPRLHRAAPQLVG